MVAAAVKLRIRQNKDTAPTQHCRNHCRCQCAYFVLLDSQFTNSSCGICIFPILLLLFTIVVVVQWSVLLLDTDIVDVGPVLVSDEDHGLVSGVILKAGDGLPVPDEASKRSAQVVARARARAVRSSGLMATSLVRDWGGGEGRSAALKPYYVRVDLGRLGSNVAGTGS